MAIYHLNIRTLSAASAASALAYFRRRPTDLGDGLAQPSKIHGHADGGTALPPGALDLGDDVWRAALDAERVKRTRPARGVCEGDLRRAAEVAKTLTLALPRELSPKQRRELVAGYAAAVAKRYGVAVEWNIHDDSAGNPHAHLMVSTRSLGAAGFGAKNRELTGGARSKALDAIRRAWANAQNTALADAGVAERVDHRTLAEQGIERPAQRRTTKRGALAAVAEAGLAVGAGKAVRNGAEAQRAARVDARRIWAVGASRKAQNQARRLADAVHADGATAEAKAAAWKALCAVCRDGVRQGLMEGADGLAVAKVLGGNAAIRRLKAKAAQRDAPPADPAPAPSAAALAAFAAVLKAPWSSDSDRRGARPPAEPARTEPPAPAPARSLADFAAVLKAPWSSDSDRRGARPPAEPARTEPPAPAPSPLDRLMAAALADQSHPCYRAAFAPPGSTARADAIKATRDVVRTAAKAEGRDAHEVALALADGAVERLNAERGGERFKPMSTPAPAPPPALPWAGLAASLRDGEDARAPNAASALRVAKDGAEPERARRGHSRL